LIQEEVAFDSIVAQDHTHSEFFSRLLAAFLRSATFLRRAAFLAFLAFMVLFFGP